jgi:hypothetical protein
VRRSGDHRALDLGEGGQHGLLERRDLGADQRLVARDLGAQAAALEQRLQQVRRDVPDAEVPVEDVVDLRGSACRRSRSG